MPGRGGEDDANLILEARFARNGRGGPSSVCPPLKAENGQTGKGDGAPLLLAHSIQASAGHHGHSSPRGDGADNQIVRAITSHPDRQDGTVDNYLLADTVRSHARPGSNSLGNLEPMAVRRLTPREAERLMGWPDDWTRWADDGTEIADSHRYRMCGNGVVAPVAQWIGHRLAAVDSFMQEQTA